MIYERQICHFGFICLITYPVFMWLAMILPLYYSPLLTALIVGFTFIFLLVCIPNYRIKKALKWEEVEAEVLISKTKRKIWIFGYNDPTYVPYVKYRYSIGGKTYINDRWNIRDCIARNSKIRAEILAEKYPKGSYIKIYVNPKNHAKSYVYKGDVDELYGSYLMFSIIAFPTFYFFAHMG